MTNEFAMWNRLVLAQTSGSFLRTHAILGPTAWVVRSVPPRARIASAPKRSVSSAISRVARMSIPYRIVGRSGMVSPSTGRKHGPMPLTDTPAIDPRSCAAAVSSRAMAMKSAHQTLSASCSAHPGRGRDVACGRVAVATISPSGRTSTPLELEVPMSTPRSSSPSAATANLLEIECTVHAVQVGPRTRDAPSGPLTTPGAVPANGGAGACRAR